MISGFLNSYPDSNVSELLMEQLSVRRHRQDCQAARNHFKKPNLTILRLSDPATHPNLKARVPELVKAAQKSASRVVPTY